MRTLIFSFFLIISNFVHAGIPTALKINLSSNDDVIVDYSQSSWKGNISLIDKFACKSADSCTLIQNLIPNGTSLNISRGVLYKLAFKSDAKKTWYGEIKTTIYWEQMVYVPELTTSDIEILANKYRPKFSFHKNEEYFPVSISDIFSRAYSDFDQKYLYKSKDTDFTTDDDYASSMSSIIQVNGHINSRIRLRKSVAREITGANYINSDNFPVYYYIQKSVDKLTITYFLLYGYDKKHYVFTADGTFGDHSIDRESMSVEFVYKNNSWIPSGVYYAGHLPSQPVEFLGCDSIGSCTQSSGTSYTKWVNGKNFTPWERTSKIGDNPIGYVAHGSHAIYPAYGWYKLEYISGKFLEEPAGNSISENLKTGNLINFSHASNDQSSLVGYSGYMIDGTTQFGIGFVGEYYRAFPYIRTPIQDWTSNSGSEFSDCVANKQGCEKYINQAIAPAITDLTFTPATANTAAKLTAIFSTDMQSGYLTTGAYSPTVGKEGYWPNARTFVVDFSSVTSGGQITLVASGFKSVSGQPMVADRVYTFPAQPTQNLLLGAPVTDSCFNCPNENWGNPNNITDGNMESGRNLGMHSGTFHIFLTNPKSIGRLKLLPAMTPNGLVYYEIQTSTDPTGAVGTWTSHGGEKSSEWANNTWVDLTLNTNTQNVRVIKVNVTYTPSWLAFFEIEGYAQ